MNDNGVIIIIEVLYGKDSLIIESNNLITLEELKKQSIAKFNINNDPKNYFSFYYEDEQGDINLLNKSEDIFENVNQISPSYYTSRIKLKIIHLNDNVQQDKDKEKKINENCSESKEKKYEEENRNLKLNLEDMKNKKEKEIKELKEIIEENKKKYLNELEIINKKYNEIKEKCEKYEGLINENKNIENIIIEKIIKEKENVLTEINKAKQITIEMNEKLENFYQNEKEKEKNNNEFIKNTNITLKEILNKLNVIDLNNQKKNDLFN